MRLLICFAVFDLALMNSRTLFPKPFLCIIKDVITHRSQVATCRTWVRRQPARALKLRTGTSMSALLCCRQRRIMCDGSDPGITGGHVDFRCVDPTAERGRTSLTVT